MKIKTIILGSALLCAPIFASSLSNQFAKMSLEVPSSKVDLESLPIQVSLYKSGAAHATAQTHNAVFQVRRDYLEFFTSEGITQRQMLTLNTAIESAFKKAKFRADLREVTSSEKILHSQWQVQGNTITRLNQ